MKERPILFSAPMVLALLAGTKTQTRRILKAEHLEQVDRFAFDPERGEWEMGETHWGGPVASCGFVRCPYGLPGDRLWVRETFYCDDAFAGDHARSCSGCVRCKHTDEDRIADWKEELYFRADGVPDFEGEKVVWKPSIFMPRWASRLSLEVTGVRVERLQEISEADAKAEGVRPFFETFPGIGRDQRITSGDLAADAEHRAAYACLWDDLNGDAASWKSNPWVWAISFRRLP